MLIFKKIPFNVSQIMAEKVIRFSSKVVLFWVDISDI